MSLHTSITPEAEARYRAQRRNSTIASLIIGMLIIGLMGLILWAIAIPYLIKKTDPIVAYSTPATSDEVVEKKKVVTSVVKKPSPSSSSSSVKVTVAATSTSSFSVTTPNVAVDSLSLDFGTSDGFGQSWGESAGFGGGSGGSFEFMGSKMSGKRICFIIDYSLSMKSRGRIELLKEELLKTFGELGNGTKYQMLFFAGPVWQVGQEVKTVPQNRMNWDIITDGKAMRWTVEMNRPGFRNKFPAVKWNTMTSSKRVGVLEAITDTPLVLGTNWRPPLEMALDMKPAPGLIVFLTDGLSGSNSGAIVKELGKDAKEKGITINTISLMEPRAREDMALLAELSGGEFSLIDENGKKVNQDKK